MHTYCGIIIFILLVIMYYMHGKNKSHPSGAPASPTISDNAGITIIRFYRPSCPYCVKSQAAWDKFKASCKFKVVDYNMDIGNYSKLLEQYGGKGVPHIVKVKAYGIYEVYNGDRSEQDLMRWAHSN